MPVLSAAKYWNRMSKVKRNGRSAATKRIVDERGKGRATTQCGILFLHIPDPPNNNSCAFTKAAILDRTAF